MQLTLALHLPGPIAEVAGSIRDAALLILKHYGRDEQHGDVRGRRAYFAGFVIYQYVKVSPSISDRPNFDWENQDLLGIYYSLNISTHCFVANMNWLGGRPMNVESFERGPWEFYLLGAANMPISLPPGARRPAPFQRLSTCQWTPAAPVDHSLFAARLSQPLSIRVGMYRMFVPGDVDAGADFSEIRETLAECYEAMDSALYGKRSTDAVASCFCLEARVGTRRGGNRRPPGRAGLRYFIGADDGLSEATKLILAFDRDKKGAAKTAVSKHQQIYWESEPAATHH